MGLGSPVHTIRTSECNSESQLQGPTGERSMNLAELPVGHIVIHRAKVAAVKQLRKSNRSCNYLDHPVRKMSVFQQAGIELEHTGAR